MAACADPDTLLHNDTYPSDVKERARAILEDCGGHSVGKGVKRTSVYPLCAQTCRGNNM